MAISQQQLDEAKSVFSKMISLLGLPGRIEARTERTTICLGIHTDDPGRLIGRNGQSLNAIQHLLNVILLNREKSFPKVSIDVQGQRERSQSPRKGSTKKAEHSIQKQAMDAVREVKRWGEAVALPPMNPEELDLVRNTLGGETDIEVETLNGNRTDKKGQLKIRLKHES